MIHVRDRLTEKFNRQRLKLELKRALTPAGVLVIGYVVAFACMAVIVANVGRELYTPSNTVSFAVDTARAVRPGVQDVRFKGIPAGAITDVKLTRGRAIVTAKVERKFGAVYRDATAVIRPKTVLQDVYLDITDPGNAAAGRATEEAPVRRQQTRTAVNVADVLETFTPRTRERLTRLLDELGGGIAGRGDDLSRSFVAAVPFLQVAGDLSRELQARARMTRRLVRNASLLTGELANRESDLRKLVAAGGETLATSADGAADLRATLAELPATIDTLERSLTSVRGVIPDLDGALGDLRPVADRLGAGLSGVRSLSAAARPAVERLERPVRELVPLARAVEPVSSRLRSAVTRLAPQVPAIDKVTARLVPCMFAIDRFFQWTPSVTKMNDARGVAPRAYMTFGLASTSLVKDPAVFAGKSCAPGGPLAGEPGPGGSR